MKEDEIIVLDPVQEMAARALILIEYNQPKCSQCGVGVLRPKCINEFGSECPRHEEEGRVQDTMDRIKKFGNLKELPFDWRYKVDIMQLVGMPSKTDKKNLRFLLENNNQFVSPSYVDTFNSIVLKECGSWSAQTNWKFALSKRGIEYAKKYAMEE